MVLIRHHEPALQMRSVSTLQLQFRDDELFDLQQEEWHPCHLHRTALFGMVQDNTPAQLPAQHCGGPILSYVVQHQGN